MLLDAEYKAAYDDAMNAYNEAQSAVYDALIKANSELEQAKKHHNQLLDSASTHEDGRKVFMDDDGFAYIEDDQRLTDNEMLDVDWKEGAPHREAFLESRTGLENKQKRFDKVNGHQKQLEAIHSEMNNHENPPTVERLKELEEEAKSISKAIAPEKYASSEMKTQTVQPSQLLDLSPTS